MTYDSWYPTLPAPDWTMQGADVTALLEAPTGPVPSLAPMTGDVTPLLDVIAEIGRENSIMLGHDPALDFSSGDEDIDGLIDSVDPYNVTYDSYDS